MRNLDVVWIEILRKIVCVQKVLHANKPIKTNGFVMISWFARFENRFEQLHKKHEKKSRQSDAKHIGTSSTNHPKSMQKT